MAAMKQPSGAGTNTLVALPKYLPTKLSQSKSWLVWRFIHTEKDKKPRKVPFYAKTGRARSDHGTDKDRKNLVTLGEALAACKAGGYSGVGLAPLDDLPFCAVDFDNCLKDGKLIKPELKPFIDSTYTEISPSGNGLRLLFAGKFGVSASVKNIASGVELFDGTGYVTVTGKRFNQKSITHITDSTKSKLRGMVQARDAVRPATSIDPEDFGTQESLGKLQAYLNSLPISYVDDRAQWLRVGMAMHQATGGSEAGFELWDKWSQRSEKYGETREKWDDDFKLGGNAQGAVGVATLHYMAKGEPNRDFDEEDPLGINEGIEAWPLISMLANPEQWHETPPPKPMLFNDLMPRGELAALAGAGGEGKSWLTLQMACSIGIGFPLCGQWAPALRGKALMLNAEDNADDYWRRVHALAQEQVWGEEEWELFKQNVHVAPVAGIEKNMTKIVNGVIVAHSIAKRLRMAVEERGYNLVVIDPAIYFRAGDENDALVQAAFMDAIAPVCCKGQATVMVVQHVAKGTRQRDELSLEDIRGSTALGGAVRWAGVMRTMSIREREMFPVAEEDRRQYVQFNIVKNSHGPVDGYWLHRARNAGGVLQYQELQPVTGRGPQRDGTGTGRGSATEAQFTDAQLIEVLRELPDITQRELATRLAVSQPAVNKRIRKLKNDGILDEDGRLIDGEDMLG